MCPVSEKARRENEGDLHVFERVDPANNKVRALIGAHLCECVPSVPEACA